MRKNTIIFIVILILAGLAAAVVFPLDKGLLGEKDIKLGLDLKGGVHLVYQADLSEIPISERDAAMDADVTAIKNRIDAFGVTEPVIQRQGDDRILVQLPGISDVDRAKDVIGQTAILEFGVLTEEDDPDVKWINDLGYWKPAVGTVDSKELELTSSYFKQNTYVTTNEFGSIILAFEWDETGSELSEQITGELYADRSPLGIFSGNEALKGDDDQPIAPRVNAVITDKGIIEGLSHVEASQLSQLLNAGRIPVPLTPIYEQTVSPVIGADFISLAVKAAIIAVLLVMIFMMIYYRMPGVLASLALVFYALLILAIFKLFSVTVTLAGLGGFVLSLGMAVDANILIFERMKEELKLGRTFGAAVESGFKRAWRAIVDSNVTTIIACIVLVVMANYIIASSAVMGFAITLIIGVLVSMFTAIIVTRTLLRLFIGSSLSRNIALFTNNRGGN
jgi:preprotein translocase subunit SecD